VDTFYDRDREQAQLEAAWSAGRPTFVTLWGRRRVGKSALLTEFATGKRAVYLYGTRATEQDILAAFALQVADALGDSFLEATSFPNWQVALDYLTRRASESRLLIVFDEFQYLCEATQGLDTLVQRWWDGVHQRANLMLVIASSAFSFMRGLTGAQGALHGRRTGQLDLLPFDYFDAAAFFPNLHAPDRVRAYACFGGIPAYLRQWNQADTLAQNIQRLLLQPGQFLFREGEELLRTEFHQEALYASILRAVAGGEAKISDIARSVGKGSADDIFDHVRRLQDLHFLKREVPITDWSRTRSQRVLYRLADPYLRFYFRYVAPAQSALQLGPASAMWERLIAPTFDEFVARTTWEEVCAAYLWRRIGAGIFEPLFTHLGRWWDGHDEIDLVGLLENRAVLVGECKWTATPVGERVLTDLRIKAAKLPLADAPVWVLASRSGFEPALRRRAEAGEVLLIEPNDLYNF
jgi:AAA+ ATPase superfamily predicted ATPase